jgi:methyltransferase-like protein 6
MKTAARHVAATMKHGGVLVIRDYGRYDEAQLKLGVSRAKRLSDNFYVKSDGTRCYYFSLEDMEQLFVDHAGLRILELKYICRVYENRAKDEKRRRIWVQGRFQKPTLLHEFK